MGDQGLRRAYSIVPRNRYLAAVAVAAFCLSVVELSDVFDLPFGGKVGAAFTSGSVFSTDVLTSMLNIGYAGLFVLMAMESAALPIPSEVVLPLAGYLVFSGKMNLGLAIAVATAAGVTGSLVDYYLALFLGRPVLYAIFGKVGISPSRLDDGERWVDSKGSLSVLVGRFIPGVRSVISIPAGILKMRLGIFVALTAVGSFVWSVVLIYLGYSAGPLWQSALGSFSDVATQVGLVLVAGLSVAYLVYYLRLFGKEGGPVASESGGFLEPGRYSPFIKFCVVGGIGVGVNEGILIALQDAGMFYLYAGAIAIELSILSNFVLNDLWTFRDRRSGTAGGRLVKFNVLMLAGLAVNLVILDAGTAYAGLAPAVANLVGIAAAFILRYALSVRYAWMSTESIETGRVPTSAP